VNSNIDSFEEKLRKIKAAPPSAKLMARLQRTLPQEIKAPGQTRLETPEHWNWRMIFLRIATPLAASVLIILAVKHYLPGLTVSPGGIVSAPAQVAELQIRPVETVDCILGARKIGTYQAPNGNPYQVVQCVGLNRQVWENMKDGRRAARTTPRQQVLLISMNAI